MKFLVLSNVCLLISSVFSTCCTGVLSMRFDGGENCEAIYLHNWDILV